MELIYVIPADAAEANPNGKFSLLGGGIENIYAPTFPAVHPGLALVVRLRALASEAQQDHKLRLHITGPNDIHVAPEVVAEMRPNPLHSVPNRTTTLNLVMNIPLLVFPEPGTYLFHLYIDSQEVETFPLDVQKIVIDESSSS